MKTNNETTKATGRPRTEVDQEAFDAALARYKAGELTTSEAAEACGLSRSAFYRRAQEGGATKSFGDLLKESVSESDTGREQIEYLPIDRIEPDPNNFYSLDGIEELAGNIELVGLQQPLRVRENENGGYTVVSGHRRLAAITLIAEGGSEQFADGVPCIREADSAVSEAMRELRLIYANSNTRVLTSAELSRQAERVTVLLYQLQEQGVEFPGRMRDHVAEACKVSKTKLARLHAIRANLVPGLLDLYDAGTLPEETAYQLGRLPKELQDAVAESMASGKRKNPPVGSVVESVVQKLEKLQDAPFCRAHAGGPACHNVTGRIVRSIFQPYPWAICERNCCMDCYKAREGCSGACQEAKARVKLEKDVEKEKQAERKKASETEFTRRKEAVVRKCRKLLPLIEAAGLADDQRIYDGLEAARVSDVRKWATEGAAGQRFYSETCVEPWRVEDLRSMARKLNVSTGQLLGEKPVSESDTVPTATWHPGDKPPRDGRYLCLIDLGNGTIHESAMELVNGKWFVYGAPLVAGKTVTCWWPVPSREGR